jgi:hypothetical protein
MNRWLVLSAKIIACLAFMALIEPPDRWRQGLGPPGWGPWRLAASHVFLAMPLAWYLVARLKPHPFLGLALPILAALSAAAESFPVIPKWLEFPARPWLLRTAASLAACMWLSHGTGGQIVRFSSKPWHGAAFLIAALVPSLAYAWKLESSASKDAATHARAGRIVAEKTCLQTRLDTGLIFGNESEKAAARIDRLSMECRALERMLSGPDLSKFDRGVILARLNRPESALLELRPVPDPLARLLAGRLHRELKDYSQAESEFRAILDSPDEELRWLATIGLAETMGDSGRHTEASLLMQSAATDFAGHRFDALLMAGSMAAEGGYGNRALQLWSEAESVDQQRGRGEIGKLRSRLLANSPSCMNGLFSRMN